MDVYGWDTVSALSLDAANRAPAQSSDRLITDFEVIGDSLSTPYVLRGKLGPWHIVPGGSGSVLRLAVPVESSTVAGGSGDEIVLDGSTVLRTAQGRPVR
ncbi:TULIP family P47-like protein [Streptomyces sp. NPDC057257]|uniref:TULIP family P47-like protein n=1 Tax=Streptomyces sp. NPDC057257 TaxID=3346071 RepID=UPI003626959B